MTNLSSFLERSAARQPDHTAIRLDDLSISSRQLGSAARRLASVRPPEDASEGVPGFSPGVAQ